MERRFEALDSWRGIAAALVMLFHFSLAINWSFQDSSFVKNPDLLVAFFFVLSSFVISHAYERKLTTRTDGVFPFMLRRFGRLYPLHLATLGAMLGWALVRPQLEGGPIFDGGLYDLTAIFTNLLLLQGLGVENHFTWNFPSWSISAEFYTYLIFALVWALLGARALLGVIAIFIAAMAFNLTSGLPGISVMMLTLCMGGFAAGAIVERIYRASSGITVMGSRTVATIAEIAAVAIVGTTMMFPKFPPALIPLVYAPVVYVFAFEGGWISTLLRTRPPRGLGTLSYSVYMIHAVVITIVTGILLWLDTQYGWGLRAPVSSDSTVLIGADAFAGNIILIGLVALTLLIATLTYRLIEVPGREWGARRAKRWRDRNAPASSDTAAGKTDA